MVGITLDSDKYKIIEGRGMMYNQCIAKDQALPHSLIVGSAYNFLSFWEIWLSVLSLELLYDFFCSLDVFDSFENLLSSWWNIADFIIFKKKRLFMILGETFEFVWTLSLKKLMYEMLYETWLNILERKYHMKPASPLPPRPRKGFGGMK